MTNPTNNESSTPPQHPLGMESVPGTSSEKTHAGIKLARWALPTILAIDSGIMLTQGNTESAGLFAVATLSSLGILHAMAGMVKRGIESRTGQQG